MNRHSYSLRLRLDLLAGGFAFFLVLAGCVALDLARRQVKDGQLSNALREQAHRAVELMRTSDELLQQRLEHRAMDAEQVAAVRNGLVRLTLNLRILHTGGPLILEHGQILSVSAVRHPMLREHLYAATAWLDQYRGRFEHLMTLDETGSAAQALVLQEELDRFGRGVGLLLDGLAVQVESQGLAIVERSSRLQMVVMCGGLALFLISVVLLRCFVTIPLHRMADGIEAMQRTGRLVKLPVLHSNELGLVASGFNHLADQVEEQKARLREHIVELQRVNLELDQLANLKDDFLETISHQLRTPLTAILEALDLLADGTLGSLNQDQQPFVRVMRDNALRLSDLIEATLDLSLLKSGRRALERRPDDIAVLLRHVQEVWQPMATTRRLQVICGALPPVYMDPESIHQVLDQLVRNALRHAPEHGEVVVQAHARDGVIDVSVQDHGPGLSPEQLGKLFQPFTHVHVPDAPGSQGSGLGLSFCRHVVERHRGAIRAESAPGQGVTVTFSLPIATTQFLFEEACRCAQERAQRESGSFGLLFVRPSVLGDPGADALMRQVETLLRRHTHRGDHFVWVDADALAIVAVTDGPGLESMAARLQGLLTEAGHPVRVGRALAPSDGESPAQLLEAARRT